MAIFQDSLKSIVFILQPFPYSPYALRLVVRNEPTSVTVYLVFFRNKMNFEVGVLTDACLAENFLYKMTKS